MEYGASAKHLQQQQQRLSFAHKQTNTWTSEAITAVAKVLITIISYVTTTKAVICSLT